MTTIRQWRDSWEPGVGYRSRSTSLSYWNIAERFLAPTLSLKDHAGAWIIPVMPLECVTERGLSFPGACGMSMPSFLSVDQVQCEWRQLAQQIRTAVLLTLRQGRPFGSHVPYIFGDD